MMKKLFYIIMIAIVCGSCVNPIAKQNKANQKAAITQSAIVDNQNEIENKGKAFVYGTRYSLEHVPSTNRSVEIDVAHRFADLAQLTLGNPSIEDSKKIREITDNLLAKADIETAKAKSEATLAKRKVAEGEKKLAEFVETIETLTEEKVVLETGYKKDLAAIQKVADGNAEKASKYDEEHTFLNSINPFYDLFKFLKKLLFLGIVIGIGTILFSVLEIIFPQFRIVGVVFGWIIRGIARMFPSIKKAAGFVSEKVYDGFKHVIAGLQHAKDVLRREPIEEKILEPYPDDKAFTKKEVRGLLEKHTEQILDILEQEQDRQQDEDTRAIVQQAKSETGLKQMASKAQI